MTDFPAFVYWLLQAETFRGVLVGGLLLSFVLPAILDTLTWRRG
jgi:hypothetical protein